MFAEHLLCSQHKYPPPIPSSEARIYLFPCHCRRKKDLQSCKSLAPDDPVAEGQSEIGTQTPVPVKLALSTHLPFPPGPANTLCSVVALPVSSPPRHFAPGTQCLHSSLLGREKDFQGGPSSSPASFLKGPLPSVTAFMTASAITYDHKTSSRACHVLKVGHFTQFPRHFPWLRVLPGPLSPLRSVSSSRPPSQQSQS